MKVDYHVNNACWFTGGDCVAKQTGLILNLQGALQLHNPLRKFGNNPYDTERLLTRNCKFQIKNKRQLKKMTVNTSPTTPHFLHNKHKSLTYKLYKLRLQTQECLKNSLKTPHAQVFTRNFTKAFMFTSIIKKIRALFKKFDTTQLHIYVNDVDTRVLT